MTALLLVRLLHGVEFLLLFRPKQWTNLLYRAIADDFCFVARQCAEEPKLDGVTLQESAPRLLSSDSRALVP